LALDAPIGAISARAYTIPTDAPESDGTLAWDSTTIVVVEAEAGGRAGLAYTYASPAAATVVSQSLAPVVRGRDAFAVGAAHEAMVAQVRNIGSRGVAACAISAVDCALWDLAARLLDIPLVNLLGRRRDSVPVYGSGGFTSYDDARLARQLGGWAHDDGCAFVKMKIGRDPAADPHRVEVALGAIGAAKLFADANGAFDAKTALSVAERMAGEGVLWFEEPVSSDDLAGLRLLRERGPAGMAIAAGEYGFDLIYFRRMLEAGAVDVLQADVTRARGITGFLRAAAVADAFAIPLSTHCAPSLHLHVACAAPRLIHMEWFHDHVRIEHMLFDGAPRLAGGHVAPDLSRAGNGLTIRRQDLEAYAV
jgi:L-alanine-DL-glutamate epimerase-like enolase superfamily enzyme